MLACGPFTANNELSYEALKDLMAVVQKDKPHCLILSGPFVNQNHEDITSGDLRYRDQNTGKLDFLDYAGLFTKVMDYIYSKLDKSTKLVVIPSTNEINHIYPMP